MTAPAPVHPGSPAAAAVLGGTGDQVLANGHRPPASQRDRILFAAELLARRLHSGRVVAELMRRDGISRRQAFKVIAAVRRLWRLEDGATLADRGALWFRRVAALGKAAEASGDLGAALAAERMLGQALGLLQPGATSVAVGVAIGAPGGPPDWRALVLLAAQAKPAELPPPAPAAVLPGPAGEEARP